MDRKLFGIRIWTLLRASLFMVYGIMMALWAPRFEQIFRDLGFGTDDLPLPIVTAILLSIPTLLWIVFCLVTAGSVIMIDKRLKTKRSETILDVSTASVFCLLLVVFVLAISMPLISLH